MSNYTKEGMFERYKQLCAQRDKTYALKADLETKLDAANARCEQARLEAAAIAKEIDEKYLTPAHFALKKEISLIAKVLSERDGLLAKKD